MATLRRLASLDSTPHASSIPEVPNHCLISQSSLPNSFFELSMRALNRASSLNRTCYKSPPCCMDSPSLHSSNYSSKLPLRRALSIHSLDHEPHTAAADVVARDCSVLPATAALSQGASRFICTASRKESTGSQSVDLQESVVYTDLRGSMWGFEAPPKFLGIHTHASHYTQKHDEATLSLESKKTQVPAFSMQSTSDDVRGMPLSLRMLKKKQSKLAQEAASDTPCTLVESHTSQAPSNWRNKPRDFTDAGNSVSRAFASLVYMMSMLQQHTYSGCVRFGTSMNESDQSCHETVPSVGCVYADMLGSYLWLFQQVFSRTPRFMLLTMMLLADFTLHSVSRHVAFPVMSLGEPPTASIFPFINVEKPVFMEGVATDVHGDTNVAASTSYKSEERSRLPISSSTRREELPHDGHEGGHGNRDYLRSTKYKGGDLDDHGRGRLLQSKLTAKGRAIPPISSSPPLSSASLHHVHEKLDHYTGGNKGINLDLLSTKPLLVAPVRAPKLEADDYPCFDRTHLAYQHEINMDPRNLLLLANYAHFLHVVRHDHARAEELYRRAVSVEGEVDGEVMGRFASFLWLAKGDVVEADRAYQAAVTADPTNAFLVGSYAHFLWNSESQEDETSSCIIDDDSVNNDNNKTSTYQHIPT